MAAVARWMHREARRYGRHVHRVLLLGAPRGGTTWVASALSHTTGATLVHEPDGTHDPFAFRAKLSMLHHPMLDVGDAAPEYERLWAGAFAGGRPTGSPADRVARWAYRGTTAEQRHTAVTDGALTPRLTIVRRMAQPLGPVRRGAPGSAHVVVKSVHAAFAAEWIAQRFAPDVAIVLRHPLEMLASWRDLGWKAPAAPMFAAIRQRGHDRYGVDLPAADAPPIARTTALIAMLTLELQDVARRHPEWVLLRHDVVCNEPEASLASAAARLGLTWSDAASQFLAQSNQPGTGYATQRVAADQVGRWRERLDEHDQAAAIDVLRRFDTQSWLDEIA